MSQEPLSKSVPMKEKPYLSPSQINRYTKCPEAYRRRYIEKDIIPPAFRLIKGSGVHSGAEANFKHKIVKKSDLPKKDIVDTSVSAFDEKVDKEGVILSEDEKSIGRKKVEGLARDSTARLADKFAVSVAPLYAPIAVEEKIRVELPGTRDLLGILDLVLPDGIQDLKTSAKKKNQGDVDNDVQLTVYASLYFKKYGKRPERIIIDNVIDRVLVKGPVTDHQAILTTRSAPDFAALANRINAVTKGIEAGMFAPANPGAWWCSPKWCEYWSTCPFVNSERRAAAEAE